MHVSIFEFKYLKIKNGLDFASLKVKTLKVTQLTATVQNEDQMSLAECGQWPVSAKRGLFRTRALDALRMESV